MTLPEPSTAIAPWVGDRLARLRSVAGLSDEDLKRFAVRAAQGRDEAALWELVQAFLGTESASGVSVSAHTLRAYRTGLRELLRHAGDNAWNLLRPGRRAGALYVATLAASGKKPATVALRVAAASALYRALRWADATDANPFTDVRRPRERTRGIVKNPPYSGDFIERMLGAADEQEAALLLLLAHAGLRIAEALGVRRGDFSQGGRSLTVRGKGGKSRTVPLSGRLRAALAALPPRPEGRLFSFGAYSSAYARLQRLARKAGVAHEFRGFHAGRKHAGTRLYAAVGDFTRVASFLGHEQVDTTRRYVALPEDDVSGVIEDF